MANHSRWEDIKSKRPPVSPDTRSVLEQELTLAQMLFDLRTEAGLTQRELAERIGTTQSAISRLEDGGGGGYRVETLARVATALGRHLVISFPEAATVRVKDGVQVA
jgi:transcriptional regulator with XRE-family HTH domain